MEKFGKNAKEALRVFNLNRKYKYGKVGIMKYLRKEEVQKMPGRREENAGKRMLKHLSAILEKSGVIIFEYHIKTDTLIRYNKELEVEVEIPKYCDYLREDQDLPG